MAAVWYLGKSNVRVITSSQWTAAGVSGSPVTSQWDANNGWSIPKTNFTAEQLSILDASGEFNTNAPDGPRVGSVTGSSELVSVYKGASPPPDRDSLWLDENRGKIGKVWDGAAWNPPENAMYARGRRSLPAGRSVVTNRCTSLLDTAAAAAGYTHHVIYITSHACTDLQFRWYRYDQSGVKEAEPDANACVFRAAVFVGGQMIPLTFRGVRDVSLTNGWVESDPLGIEVPANTDLVVGTYLISGGMPFCNWWAADATYATYSSGDATTPTSVVGNGYSAWIWGPSLVFGTPQDGVARKPVVGVFGESVPRGFNDTGKYGGLNGGFAIRALDDAGLPSVQIARASASASDWSDPFGRKHRVSMIADVDAALASEGLNDLVNGATALQTETSLIGDLNSIFVKRGIPVWVCTLTPSSSSTDSWATVGNQTTAAYNAARVAINNWIRGGCPLDNATSLTPVAVGTANALVAGQPGHPVKGYFEVADLAESARDSGKWKVNYTADGLHPNATGAAALAAAVDTTKFVLR